MITYHLTLKDPAAHEFELQMWFATNGAETIKLKLPAWIPGSYMIRDFARNLMDLKAVSEDGESREIDKLDKQTWLVDTCNCQQITLSYRVYAFDLSVRSAFFDTTRAYFNGTSVFLSVEGREQQVHRVQLAIPDFAEAQDWLVSSTLPPLDVDERGFGLYQAEDYPALIDFPVEIGCQESIGFDLQGIPHQMCFSDAPGIDLHRLAKDVAPLCAEHAAMFGELPIERYLFMTLATADAYGGLEHRDSTSLVCKRADLPYPSTDKISKDYRTYLALCSHEYFHLWNVKRIRPQVLADADLSEETYTELLWAFEGITSYYDELALPRAGVINTRDYLEMLAPTITRYLRNSGRKRQSIAESSFDAWTRFYKQDESAPNVIVSYYNKGGLVAFGLDHLIRTHSGDQKSLDDLMRLLWEHHGSQDKGIPERGIEQHVKALVDAPVDQFFARYVYGTDELPLQGWFADYGIGLCTRGAKSADDQGAAIDADSEPPQAAASLAARTSAVGGMLRVDMMLQGSAAYQAGLAVGDLLLALDGERITAGNLGELMSRYAAGSEAQLSYFRRDRLKQTALPIRPADNDTCDLYLIDESSLLPEVKQRRENWLRSSTRRPGS